MGRIDQSVRGISPADLAENLAVVRERIAPHFDITPEVLTHAQALDFKTGALLPHTESAWVSHLAGTGRHDDLRDYLRHAWTILGNVGLRATGITIGGMPDQSGITQGKSLLTGHYEDQLATVLWQVVSEFVPGTKRASIFGGPSPQSEEGKRTWLPEPVYTAPDGGEVFTIHVRLGDILLGVFHGDGDVDQQAELLVSSDLQRGSVIELAESGYPLMLLAHAQTLTSLNTGKGVKLLHKVMSRLHERYGKQIQWMTPREMREWAVAKGRTLKSR